MVVTSEALTISYAHIASAEFQQSMVDNAIKW